MTRAAIEFRLLGPLEARVGGAPVALGGPKQRALVALLVLHANDVVPVDVLIEEMWEGTPPAKALAFVQNCVSRLRDVLGKKAIETRPPGYRLLVDPDSIDARRFERLVREARERPARERAVALREALELWQGAPLSDLAYWGFAQHPIRLLEEHRINALQMRLEAELELGLHRESVGELDALAREHPTHERLRWLQMLALHRSDRRLDALAAYQEARLAIVEESGMEPGGELRALQRRILQDDPTLMPGGIAADEVVVRTPQLARRVVAVCIVELLVDEEIDVEAARGVVSRGLAALEEIVLRHGGTVEQLLGEEALAVFGLPAAHEDDVLRALRTAMELRDALSGVEMRAAVETGEVLVGENGCILSGSALTTARRVKEGAPAGEIHVGPAAAAQSAGAAWTDASDGSHRLLELVEGAPAVARRPDAPLVGRRAELERLVLTVRESAASSSCRRVVVLGEPGIGKTRLAAELVRTIESEARVLYGRCVPYADGATYLPLADVLRQVADGEELGPALKAVLTDETEGEVAATRLVDALSGSGAVDSGDVFWAARKLLEALARKQPVVVVFEDVHWAEPTFLDLIEYVAGWSTGAPIMLVCLARTELLDARPAWTADTIPLRPLSDDETADLLDAMPEALAIDEDARAAVVAAAEGNPLFLEQLAAHALDGPLGPGHVPASLESLLASRLDSLKPDERAVLERAAIVGREFTRAAVDAISPEDTRGSASALLALVRRRLVRPDTERADDDAFLFDHALIRDATYAAVAKADRARLHEQLARWHDERGDLDEIVGFHLEEATKNYVEIGAPASVLGREASRRLEDAAMNALRRTDHRAQLVLLTRASALLDEDDERRLEVECLRASALKWAGQGTTAAAQLEDVARRARASGDRRIEMRCRIEQIAPQLSQGLTAPDEVLELVERAIPIFETDGDDYGVARACHVAATVYIAWLLNHTEGELMAFRAREHYRLVGLGDGSSAVLLAVAALSGPMPVEQAISRCRDLLDTLTSQTWANLVLPGHAILEAMAGRFDAAREQLEVARATRIEMADPKAIAMSWSVAAAWVELLADEPKAAETILAEAHATLADHSDSAALTTNRAWAAEAVYRQGRFDEAFELATEAQSGSLAQDIPTQSLALRVRGKSLARLGRPDEGELAIRQALELVSATDDLNRRAEVYADLADLLLRKGEKNAALKCFETGLALFEAKGNIAAANHVRKGANPTGELGGEATGLPPNRTISTSAGKSDPA